MPSMKQADVELAAKIAFTIRENEVGCPLVGIFSQGRLAPIVAAGESLYSSPKHRQINRLQNTVILVFIILHFVQVTATACLGGYLLLWDTTNFHWGLAWYLVVPALMLWAELVLLRRKMDNRWGAWSDFTLQIVFILGTVLVSLFMGFSAGFWLFLIPALFNSFIIFQGDLRRQFSWFALNLAGFLGAVYAGMHVPALLPLPARITAVVFWLISSVLVCVAVILGAIIWWRLGLTTRFLNLWKRWSIRGVELFSNEIDKKYRIIQNQLMLLFGVLTGYLILVELWILSFLISETPGLALQFTLHYGPLTAIMMIILCLCIVMNAYTRSYAPVVVGLGCGICFVGFVGISLQREAYYYLYLYGFLPIPFIALPFRKVRQKILSGGLVVAAAAWIIFCHWFLATRQSLMPVPSAKLAAIIGYAVLSALAVTLIFFSYYAARQSRLAENNIEAERQKSDDLLLNILPAEVAHELKEQGRTRPILFQSATVFFTDFVGFTKIAEHLPPEELVGELDKCFSYFDSVCARYNLEKLKTIGDAFMAAGGIPKPNNTHAIDCCLAALEIQSFMRQMKEIKEKMGFPYWELRLGINSGNLVAGVVGEKKFAYDVWGDTVNTASRMESSGVPGRINISKATYDQVRFLFECESRGKITAKNKGEIHMYFLHRIKEKYSADDSGLVPNAEFRNLYDRIAAGARLVPRNRA